MSKKLQSMPVFDRMYPGANYKIPSKSGLNDFQVSAQFFRNLADFKRFKLDDDLRIPTPGDELWNVAKIFGHLRLPYPKVWIEWTNRRKDNLDSDDVTPWPMAALCIQKSEHTKFMLEMFGARIQDSMKPHLENTTSIGMFDNSWAIYLFEMTTGTPRLIPGVLLVHLDDNGMFQGVDGRGLLGKSPEDVTMTLVDLGWDALAAIGLLNCRNVTTKSHDRAKNLKKRRRPNRDKAATLDFATIELPGSNESSSSPGARTDTMARHMARGHFKTFTEDAPLFGKYTGTYWWGWQLRGNRKNGEVISDYRVA